MHWNDAVKSVKGIGDKTSQILGRLGICTVGDLVTYYPRDYDSYKGIVPVSSVREGMDAVVEGTLAIRPTMTRVRNLTIVNARLKDSTGSIRLTWFNMPYIAKTLKMGSYYIIRGKVSYKNESYVIEQPVLYSKKDYYAGLNKLLPVYRITKGISNNNIRKYISMALESVEYEEDYLPAGYCRENSLFSRTKAIKAVHFPDCKEDVIKAHKRLAYDEFFLFLISLKRLKGDGTDRPLREAYVDGGMCGDFMDRLPYSLTGAQLKVWEEIKADMSSGHAMTRLIQGDVGSGKTILAVLALLYNYENGYQGIIMAPTEVLARQHYESIGSMLEYTGINIGLLTGSMTASSRRSIYEGMKDGSIDIVIGTHAVIQEKAEYNRLGLVITDEQHRFGVNQRIQLAMKGNNPHTMVMSATPIPRTLAMIIYGDMDISVVDELPQGRLPIKNCVVGTSYRGAAYKLIVKEVRAGNQVYIICPMIEEDEESSLESVEGYTDKLTSVLPEDIRIGSLHGRMSADEKNDIMTQYVEGNIDVLVSTTVIEVGINVPSATVMMIENSERFGLAALHQLRGRVGRGNRQSYCIFMHGDTGEENIKRLNVLGESNDGFHIASEDLKLRGPGDMFGIRQSGELVFRYADIYGDSDVLFLANDRVRNMSNDTVEECINTYGYLNRYDLADGNVGL